jgi:hypothetical protein
MTDQTEIARELKAIREVAIYILVFVAGIFVAVLLASNQSPKPPPPPPPEIRHHDKDLPYTPVAPIASRGGSHGPSREGPVCKTLAGSESYGSADK